MTSFRRRQAARRPPTRDSAPLIRRLRQRLAQEEVGLCACHRIVPLGRVPVGVARQLRGEEIRRHRRLRPRICLLRSLLRLHDTPRHQGIQTPNDDEPIYWTARIHCSFYVIKSLKTESFPIILF